MKAHIIFNEILNADETLSSVTNFVGILGSGNIDSQHPYYKKAYELSLALIKEGYSILTGGGGGVMEAANCAACTGRGVSAGLCLKFKGYEKKNEYINPGMDLEFSSFFSRKATLLNHVKGIVIFPGGIGTLDEFFEIFLALRAKKIIPMQIYLIEKAFWGGLIEWMLSNIFEKDLAPQELLSNLTIVDDLDIVINDFKDKNNSS